MGRQNGGLLNQLAGKLPEGLLVDAAWLEAEGYSRQLRHEYVAAGWLEQPARSVYRRPRGDLSWQQVIISLQTILGHMPLRVGGRTALELQGYAHYLAQAATTIHLYGPAPPPTWVGKLPLPVAFSYHNDKRLFRRDALVAENNRVRWDIGKGEAIEPKGEPAGHTTRLAWGQWDWPLLLSSPERAALELLDELPRHETFEQVDALFSGLSNLRPRGLQELLAACTNVKVKRLFFFFATRHQHAWLKRLDRDAVDFGSGKRMLVKGGVLDPTYQITVPGGFNGVR